MRSGGDRGRRCRQQGGDEADRRVPRKRAMLAEVAAGPEAAGRKGGPGWRSRAGRLVSWQAPRRAYPKGRAQRCWVCKTRNALYQRREGSQH